MEIHVSKIEEAGHISAMLGLALNKNQSVEAMPMVAQKLKSLDKGHNKFMEHLIMWVMVTAPRYWWQDADTYRLTSKQSQSTNHTILKRPLQADDFEDRDISQEYLAELNELILNKEFLRLKKKLPEGFLQTREWRLDYKTIRNMILQRRDHKLPHWPSFLVQLKCLCSHPEYLPEITKVISSPAVTGIEITPDMPAVDPGKYCLKKKDDGGIYTIVRAWEVTKDGVTGLMNRHGNIFIGRMSPMMDAFNFGFLEFQLITGDLTNLFVLVPKEDIQKGKDNNE